MREVRIPRLCKDDRWFIAVCINIPLRSSTDYSIYATGLPFGPSMLSVEAIASTRDKPSLHVQSSGPNNPLINSSTQSLQSNFRAYQLIFKETSCEYIYIFTIQLYTHRPLKIAQHIYIQ